MKQITKLLALMCILLAAASCNKETEIDTPQTPTNVAQLIKIAPFPAFDEGAQTRAVGTEDAGKTTWENGDVVLLEIQFVNEEGTGSLNTLTLTYDGTAWKADKSLDLNLPDYRATATVTAYYAPDYAWVADPYTGLVELTHKGDPVKKGTSEFITYRPGNVNLSEGITIDFAQTTRTYSRLRIATLPNATINVKLALFTPANALSGSANLTFTLTADAKGNAYLYGKWINNITVRTKDNTTVLATKTVLQPSSEGKSYALAAYPAGSKYDEMGNGTPENPYQIWNATQLQSMRGVTAIGSLNTIFEDKHIKLITDIDCSSIPSFEPIGSPKGQFAGTFDGNGHTISNLKPGTIQVSKVNTYSGLFGITANATIRNLTLKDPGQKATGYQKSTYAGTLIGKMSGGAITNCHVVGSIPLEGDTIVGGLIGTVEQGTLLACSSAIPVTSQMASGGLVGQGSNLTLIGCRVTSTVSSNGIAGGLVGSNANANANVLSSYFSGNVAGGKAGSFVGEQSGGALNLYYCAATSSSPAIGAGSAAASEGVQVGCAVGALYDVMVNAAAETIWSTNTNFAAAYAAFGKPLSGIWVNVPGAAPKLWWEK